MFYYIYLTLKYTIHTILYRLLRIPIFCFKKDNSDEKKLRSLCASATSFAEWSSAALKLDLYENHLFISLLNNQVWKEGSSSQDYDYEVLEERLNIMKDLSSSTEKRIELSNYMKAGKY